MMDRRNPIIVIALAAALLLPATASALTDLERAREEFVCEPPEGRDEYKDDLFDEAEIPSAVSNALGAEQASKAAGEGDDDDSAAGEAVEPTPSGDELLGANDAELDAWREAERRFEERALEFATEASRIIRRKYSEEASELEGLYQRQLGHADIEERQLRGSAITAHERFVKDHPDTPYTARRMFRLAELYFEQSEEDWIVAGDRYNEMLDLFDEGKLEFLPEPPDLDLRQSIALYKRIIRKFPDYGDLGAVYYMLGYCYSDDASRHLDPERAEQTYLALLDNVQDSPYRAQAYFRLGDLYFEENQHERALAYYREIVDEIEAKGKGGFASHSEERLYELALYKLAWAYYKIDDLDVAIGRFMTLLDWAERKEAQTGKVADLKPESVRYLAISFSDSAVEQGISPIGFARQSLQNRADSPWAFDVLVELATILRDQARFEDAIDAYVELQRMEPLHPLGPEFQNNIIVLYQNLVIPDEDAAAAARVELTNRFGLDSDWYEANKNNKEATTLATKYILDSLQWVAYAYHTKAQQSGDPSDYLLAARKYVEYLDRYPFADNAYELNYYLADCYFRAGDTKFKDDAGEWTNGYAEAIKQYAYLFGFPEDSHQRDAIIGIMYAYNYIWTGTEGEALKDNPEALANIKPPLGQTVQFARMPLTDLEIDYIRSIRWVQREVPDQKDLPTLLYDIGQIYYYKNHLERARGTFMELIEHHPQTDYAAGGAGLIVNSYKYTGDLSRMRDATERFAMLGLGADEELRQQQTDTFESLARASLFKEGEMAYGMERYQCALLSFLEYYEMYGHEATDEDPKQIDGIVYNIALSYSKVGKAEASTRYYELMLERFPHSENAPNTFWKMAQNFEQLFELERAVDYYENLMRYHPDHEDVPNALYNSGFLAIGLERFADAARAYEKYHDRYKEAEESRLLLFRAAELWEADDNRREAKRLYKKWMDLYGDTDADRWVDTQWKLAEFARADGKTRDADRLVETIADSYEVLREELIAKPGIGLKISAQLGFRPLLADYEQYILLTVPNTNDMDQLQEFIDQKLDWNTKLKEDFDAFVIHYPDFEWQTAALFHRAQSFQNHGNTWKDAPNPFDCESEDMDEQDRCFMYMDMLLERAQPFEDSALEAYKQVVDFAKQKKRYTPWVGKALEELSRIDPNTYPVPKPESTSVIPSDSATLPPMIQELPEETSALDVAPNGVRLARREVSR
jgi:cellulose synthase operon protein C